MSMVAYSEVIKDRTDPIDAVFKFTDFEPNVYMREYYCSNPDCDCTNVLLEFFESESDELNGMLFSFYLDLETDEYSKPVIENKKIKYKAMIAEFKRDITLEIKDRFRAHAIKINKHFQKEKRVNLAKSFDTSLITSGASVAYYEVFGDLNSNPLLFTFDNKDYFVEDQYCMKPNCPCNDAILCFKELQPKQASPKTKFVIRLHLKNNRYEVEMNYGSGAELREIADYFIREKKDLIVQIRKHYAEMKEQGKILLDQQKQDNLVNLQEQVEPSVKVGRNDPCVCGSGKKYKKCCG